MQRNFSVPYDYLKKNKSKFPAARVVETYTQISQIDSGVETIITGFVETEQYIFVVENDCSVIQRSNFAAVGTGAYIAEPALYQRNQNRSLKVGKSLYHVYEAKRLAEIAEGVGSYTILEVIAPPGNEKLKFTTVHEKGLEFFEKMYREYGLKTTTDVDFLKKKRSRKKAKVLPEAKTKLLRLNKKAKYLAVFRRVGRVARTLSYAEGGGWRDR